MSVVPTSNDHHYDKEKIWKEQDFQVSARLILQNWIWENQLGYVLHPKIDIPKDKAIRVADVACNNGAWMLDLARQRPNATFDGFDLSPNNFPAPAWRLPNFNFHVWDAATAPPDEFVGAFDVVQIRAFYSVILDNETEPYLTNVLRLLKPGGCLQWVEGDMPTLTCEVPPGHEADAEAVKRTVSYMNQVMLGRNRMKGDWLRTMASTLQGKGCEVLADDRSKPRPEFQRAWNDNFLTVFMSMIQYMPEEAIQPGTLSRKSYTELILKCAEDCKNGAWIHHDVVVFVARKAS